MKKIPVNIISGFLGSGKTTAIIQLLGQKRIDEQWAVIINEFGKVSIDGQTLKSDSEPGTVFEISGGCICCSAKGYFSENLEQITQSGNYSRIIIEPSGLGGVDMVSEIVGANPALQLMPVICLVDILGIENLRLQLNPIYRMQIAKADVIVFSKCDLITNEAGQKRLIKKFEESFPNKQLCQKTVTNLMQFLFGMDKWQNKEVNEYKRILWRNPNFTDRNYQEMKFKFDTDCIFDSDKLTRFFIDHPSIIRAKGHLRLETGWKLVNFTLSGYRFDPCQAKEQSEMIIITDKSDDSQFEYYETEIGKVIS